MYRPYVFGKLCTWLQELHDTVFLEHVIAIQLIAKLPAVMKPDVFLT
jgi:hypothetical protein